MSGNSYLNTSDEKPLDQILENGGATAIFRSIVCKVMINTHTMTFMNILGVNS